MLQLLPRQLPTLAVMLDDIGRPSARALAKALGISERTVYRWMVSGDDVPRLALAAVFWLTRWGQSVIEAQAVNTARDMAGLVSALRTENDALAARCERLLALSGGFGAANCPLWNDPGPRRAGKASGSRTRPRNAVRSGCLVPDR